MHTFEIFVDIKECEEDSCMNSHIMATRYEISAENPSVAHDAALDKAEHDYPRATEYDIRITRLLR